jgi:hypothetical protein
MNLDPRCNNLDRLVELELDSSLNFARKSILKIEKIDFTNRFRTLNK